MATTSATSSFKFNPYSTRMKFPWLEPKYLELKGSINYECDHCGNFYKSEFNESDVIRSLFRLMELESECLYW